MEMEGTGGTGGVDEEECLRREVALEVDVEETVRAVLEATDTEAEGATDVDVLVRGRVWAWEMEDSPSATVFSS